MYKLIDSLNLHFVPRFVGYDPFNKTLTMQRIQGMNVSDFYGESFSNVPQSVVSEARSIIRTLYENNRIVYPDITGYNFILEKGTEKIWLIDFEHCIFRDSCTSNEHIKFVEEFIGGKNSWNPYFA